jgi:hypothetical protein
VGESNPYPAEDPSALTPSAAHHTASTYRQNVGPGIHSGPCPFIAPAGSSQGWSRVDRSLLMGSIKAHSSAVAPAVWHHFCCRPVTPYLR